MRWQCRQFEFRFPRPTLLMGIVNVTPDSFWDGGRFLDPAAAVAHARQLVKEGADILDIGGESTRPHASPVAEAEELRRVLPVIEALAGTVAVPLSIDTRKPAVARAALERGASIVNDIEACRVDDTLWRIVADAGAGYVCMHMQGTPRTMQQQPNYREVVSDIDTFFRDRLTRLAQAGVRPAQVALDPGIGFGKTPEHTLDLLARVDSYKSNERPLVLGVSRKSFLGRLLDVEGPERLPGALACSAWAVAAGVEVLRTHDVAATRQAARMTELVRDRRQHPRPA